MAHVLFDVIERVPYSMDDHIRNGMLSSLDKWSQRNGLVLEALDLLVRSKCCPDTNFVSVQAYREKQAMLQEINPIVLSSKPKMI